MKGFRIGDQEMKYIEDLAVALDRHESWIIRKLVEYAVEQHKKGEIEL